MAGDPPAGSVAGVQDIPDGPPNGTQDGAPDGTLDSRAGTRAPVAAGRPIRRPARPRSLAAQRAASRTAEERSAEHAPPVTAGDTDGPTARADPPDWIDEPDEPLATMVVSSPQPVRAMWATGWPLVACVLLAAFIIGMLFPLVGLPLLIFAPLAVGAAFLVAAQRAKAIRLEVSKDAVRVSNDKTGLSCQRSDVHSALLVESFERGPLMPSTTDLILLNRAGRSLIVLTGLLWPPAILDRVVDVLGPIPVERVTGKQTPQSLARRYPEIVKRADRERAPRGASGRGMLIAVAVLLVGAVVVALRMFVTG